MLKCSSLLLGPIRCGESVGKSSVASCSVVEQSNISVNCLSAISYNVILFLLTMQFILVQFGCGLESSILHNFLLFLFGQCNTPCFSHVDGQMQSSCLFCCSL